MGTARFVGAIDQGTTSTRFLLFDRQGRIAGAHQREHRQHYPQPGWVEHDPEEIWRRTEEVIAGALRQAGLSAADLAAVGITNQRETTVLWDRKSGRPVSPAIVWQDTRTAGLCEALAREGGRDRFRPQTGLPLATYFSGPKIRWLLDTVPGLQRRAEKGEILFGTMDTWLIWNLTGGAHVTDPTNASRTLLMNLETLAWDASLLDAFGIPRAMLPEIRPSSDPAPYGWTRSDGPFGSPVPITGNLGDQQAALFGQACLSPGEAKNTYGTGCFLLLNTGERPVPSRAGLLTTVAYRLGDRPAVYALEGSVAVAGALVQWARDKLGIISSAREINNLAATAADNGGVFFVPAFSGLFAPHWREDARGVIAGLTHFAGRGHLARAILEATAFQTGEIFEAMTKDAGIRLRTLKVDGGMVESEILMQFQADILDTPVIRPRVAETTALGAAYAAGLAVGFWQGEDEVRANWEASREWLPSMPEAERRRLKDLWLRAVERSLGWAAPEDASDKRRP